MPRRPQAASFPHRKAVALSGPPSWAARLCRLRRRWVAFWRSEAVVIGLVTHLVLSARRSPSSVNAGDVLLQNQIDPLGKDRRNRGRQQRAHYRSVCVDPHCGPDGTPPHLPTTPPTAPIRRCRASDSVSISRYIRDLARGELRFPALRVLTPEQCLELHPCPP